MSEVKKSQFENSPDWEVRIAELLTNHDLEYDEKRLEMFIKRAFAYKGSLDKTYKPTRQNFSEFADATFAANIEDMDHNHANRQQRMAELALVMDGLYGTDYPEMGRIHGASLAIIRREGAYGVWRSSIGRALAVIRDDLNNPVVQEENEQQNAVASLDHTENSNNVDSPKSKTNKPEYKSATEPDYADIEDVIKYLFQSGNISPTHAAILMVTLGYQRPDGKISDALKNDIQRVRSDLLARIAVRENQALMPFQERGVRVISTFLRRSALNPDLKLTLDDNDLMLAAGSELVSLHQLKDVRTGAPRERADKYDGMGTIIPID